MVRKKLAVMIAALGAFQTSAVNALGLGELKLDSALNQPLDAEIRLLETGDLDNTQILVKLGNQTDFERAGISRDFFLSNLKFEVVLDGAGAGIVKVNTKDNVIEPYLDFIVEARWPSGKILREYTVLFDLPTFSAAPALTATPAAAASAKPTATVQPKVTTVAAPTTVTTANNQALSSRESLRQGALEPGETYRVRRDDTLWEIAAQARPNSSTSVQQTMLGIQRNNPEAFFDGNINRLKAGYILRLPTEQDIADLKESVAKKEVANQNRAWKTGEKTPSLVTDAPLDARTNNEAVDAPVDSDARLSIAGSGDNTAEGSEGEGEAKSGRLAQLDSELVATEEQLEEAKLHNEELSGRLGDMEAKMATLQRLLELKEEQLAALQASKASPAVEETSAAKPAVKEPVVAAAAESEDEGFVQQLINNPLYLGAGAGILGLALVAAIIRRRKQSAEEAMDQGYGEEIIDEEISELSLGDEELTEVSESLVESEEASLDLETANVGDFAFEEPEEGVSMVEDVAAESVVAETQPVQSETGDALTEADIYLAYGRFQQALDLLKTAHHQEPERADILVKLLEVCIEAREKPLFQEYYMTLQALGDESAIIQVKETLSSVEGVSGWLDSLPGTLENFTDADMDADLIEGEQEESAADLAAAESLSDSVEVSVDSLDDELALDLDVDDLELELDLDDDFDALAGSETMQFDAAALNESLDEEFQLEDKDTSESLVSGSSLDLDLDSSDTAVEEEGFDIDLDDELSLDDDLEALSLDEGAGFSAAPLDELNEIESLDELDAGLGVPSENLDEVVEASSLSLTDDLDNVPVADSSLDVDMPLEITDEVTGTDLELEDFASLNDNLDEELAELESFENLEELEEAAGSTDDLLDLSMDLESSADELSEEVDSNLSAADELVLTEKAEPLEDLSEELVSLGDLDTELELDDSELIELDMDSSESIDSEALAESLSAGVLAEEGSVATESFDTDVSSDDSGELDFLSDADEVATKLDLARAYIDMGDSDGAREILDEVIQEGDDTQKQEAQSLLDRV